MEALWWQAAADQEGLASPLINAALLQDKYLLTREPAGFQNNGDYRRLRLEYVARVAASKLPASEYQKLRDRQFEAVSRFDATTDYRLITGLGEASVLETYIYLHPLYGFPVIRGSSLKGLCVHYLKELDPGWDTCLVKEHFDGALEEFTLGQIAHLLYGGSTGAQRSRGAVVFHDAWPTELPNGGILEVDVMTPHYGGYYGSQGGEAPTEHGSGPNPIPFLVIKPGVSFRFGLSLASGPLPAAANEILGLAQVILHSALEDNGAGGKTGSGYGYFHT